MIYDGFIVLDTREPGRVVNAIPAANAPRHAVNKMKAESGYGPGFDPNNPYLLPDTEVKAPAAPSSGGGNNLGQYLNPATIVAGAGLLSALAGTFQKTGEQKNLKSVCGRKPLLNIGGKKDKYRACVDNYIFRQNQPAPTQEMGMDQGTKTLVIVLSVLAVIILIIVGMVAMKNKNTAPAA